MAESQVRSVHEGTCEHACALHVLPCFRFRVSVSVVSAKFTCPLGHPVSNKASVTVSVAAYFFPFSQGALAKWNLSAGLETYWW